MICRRLPAVEFVQRKFDDHTTQWNSGLVQIKTEWVLSLDADYVLLALAPGRLRFQDRLRRKIVFAPWLVFFYMLFGKGLILDGWPGCYYVLQRTIAEMILSLRLLEQKLKR